MPCEYDDADADAFDDALPAIGSGRDDRGRFVRGGPPGPGRPPGYSRLAELLDSALTDEIRRDIIAALADRAKAGDVRAAEFLFDRAYGKPRQAISVGPEDLDPVTSIEVRFAPQPSQRSDEAMNQKV